LAIVPTRTVRLRYHRNIWCGTTLPRAPKGSNLSFHTGQFSNLNLAPSSSRVYRTEEWVVGSALLRSGFRAVGATAALAQYHSRAVLRIWLMEPASTIRQRYCTP
jgi:hypothetical protein